ncbi:MAG: heavy-metal-associated domain-containing protein, partial [Candidatus Delongbacteria bacterium]|nr:heavy-metal-associated domain-containing protein [Candidatus Delongbacteria bacterium]
MKHLYKVTGMTCVGCKASVENSLSNIKEITKITVDLKKEEAVLEMTSHVSTEKLQEALTISGLHYTIEDSEVKSEHHHKHHHTEHKKGNGIYYCPMRCEGNKTHDKPGSCSVCGMDLVEQPSETSADESGQDKTYKKLLKK